MKRTYAEDRAGSTRQAGRRLLGRLCPSPRLGRSLRSRRHRPRAAAPCSGTRARRRIRLRPVERPSPRHRVPSRPRSGRSCAGGGALPRGRASRAACLPVPPRPSAPCLPGALRLELRLVVSEGERTGAAPARPSSLEEALGARRYPRLRAARRARLLQYLHCLAPSRHGLARPGVADGELLVRCRVPQRRGLMDVPSTEHARELPDSAASRSEYKGVQSKPHPLWAPDGPGQFDQ